MKRVFLLSLLLATTHTYGADFEKKALGEKEGMRLEVLDFVLPANEAAAIIDKFDGSDRSAAACFENLSKRDGKAQWIYRGVVAEGKNEFESTFENADASLLRIAGEHPELAAVAIIGEKGAKDRRAVLLFLRAYERQL